MYILEFVLDVINTVILIESRDSIDETSKWRNLYSTYNMLVKASTSIAILSRVSVFSRDIFEFVILLSLLRIFHIKIPLISFSYRMTEI